VREVYGVLLPLAGDATENYAGVIGVALEWALGRYMQPPLPTTPDGRWAEVDGVEIAWETLRADDIGPRVWTMTFRHPHGLDPDLCWISEIKVGDEGTKSWVSVRVALMATSHRVRPIEFIFQPPQLVSRIAEVFEIIVDGRRLTPRAGSCWSAEIPELCRLLSDPTRILPMLVISVDRDRRTALNPHATATRLIGLSHVTVLGDYSSAFALTNALGRDRSVFNGGVRLYYPGFAAEADPFRHPLWLPSTIAVQTNFVDLLVRRLAPMGAFRTPSPSVEGDIRSALLTRRHLELQQVAQKAEKDDADWQWLESELDRTLEENRRLQTEVRLLQQSFADVARTQQTEIFAVENAPITQPTSVLEAIQRAREQAQYLVFHERAVDSAGSCSYGQPDRIFDALMLLDQVAGQYHRREPLPQGIDGACKEHGLVYAPAVSEISRGKYKQDYQITYEGQRVYLGPHLKLGKGDPETCSRIYFYRDEENRAFVIGYVGHHLRDGTTS